MTIFEFHKDDAEYAEKITELAEMSITIAEPKSFSSDLSDIIQIGVELAPYAISSVTLIIIEMLKKSKSIKIKISENSLEVEGLSEKKTLQLAKNYIMQGQEHKASELIDKLLEENEK